MEDTKGSPHSHLFMLRVWHENLGANCGEWRGQMKHVTSGKTQYIRDWSALITIIQDMINETKAGENEKAADGLI